MFTLVRHCERSEAIQVFKVLIASLRSAMTQL